MELKGYANTTDATLSGLALENADDDSTIALNQTFATATKSYTASVLNGVDEITVLPETTDDGATVAYLDGSDAAIADADGTKDDQQVALVVGANTIKVKVTAQDATTTESYTVVVTRAPAAGGICGRTLAVQTAILGKISGVSACADVTTANLAAITGTLDLASKSIAALAEGDFAGLTALTALNLASNDLASLRAGVFDPLTELTSLNLFLNDLTELPAGVFDTLTKLTSLDLSNNELSFLRAGVFDELTMLLSLALDSNQLSALPDRVFEKLTLLVTLLHLSDNPGTDDFVPTAMAAATPATIPTTGGDVVLDAAGSGGAWGTNVTYAWALTDPSSGVTVTYDPDATSARTTATVPGSLTDGSTLTFTLTVTGIGFPTPGTDTVEVVTVVAVGAVLYMLIEPDPNSDTALTVKWRSVYLRPRLSSAERITDYDIQYAEELSGWPYRVDGEDWLTVTYPRWVNRMTWQGWSGTIESFETRSLHWLARLEGLTTGQAYRIRMRARTADGPGPWSLARPGQPRRRGSQATALEPLTAAFEDVPEGHDGSSAFTLRLAFSDEVALDEAGLRAALLVSNGAVTGVDSVSADLWEITIQPNRNDSVSVLLSPPSDCEAAGAICTDDGRKLSAGLGASVPFVPQTSQQQTLAPLTASFVGVPGEHTGETFTFGLTFSEELKLSFRRLRDAAFDVSGGTVRRAKRQQSGSDRSWTIHVEPDSDGTVTIELPETTNCSNAGAICTDDGRKLNHSTSATIPGAAAALDFAHFANGTGITSEMVFLNPSTQPSRPAVYFYDTEGNPIAPDSVVDITGDLEITEDGGLTVQTEMEPLGELTISTHWRGGLVTGSVRVVSDGPIGPIGGLLRFDLPGVGAGVVGASLPISDAIFPVRRQEGGINTWAAIHNLESSPGLLLCDLMREGVLLDAASIPLEANGQTSWFIDQAFPAADTSDFAGSVRCDAVGEGLFSAVALELDPATRTFITLPVFPVPEMPDRE